MLKWLEGIDCKQGMDSSHWHKQQLWPFINYGPPEQSSARRCEGGRRRIIWDARFCWLGRTGPGPPARLLMIEGSRPREGSWCEHRRGLEWAAQLVSLFFRCILLLPGTVQTADIQRESTFQFRIFVVILLLACWTASEAIMALRWWRMTPFLRAKCCKIIDGMGPGASPSLRARWCTSTLFAQNRLSCFPETP